MPNQSPSLFVYLIAVPIFILTIAIEWWLTVKRREPERYDLADTVSNLQLGSGQLLVGLISKAPLLAIYHMMYQAGGEWGVTSWDESSVWMWILGFIVMDFAYYWFHRFSHEINFLWAAHAVHHQSEYYNLSVALRQSWIQLLYSGIFYLPLALLGIPTSMFFLLNALNTLSQYWIHTQLIGRLGRLELILNTPSHHRVHHGTDEPYIDKNYAGALIIWDRMFGTFTQEESTPRFGVIKPLRTWNPGWANIDVWILMWRRVRRRQLNFIQMCLLPFRAPAWMGQSETPLPIQLRTEDDYQLYTQRGDHFIYSVCMSFVDIVLASILVACAPQLTYLSLNIATSLILLSAIIHGALMEGRWWATRIEVLKYCTLLIMTLVYKDTLNQLLSTPGITLSKYMILFSLAGILSLYISKRYNQYLT